jgi:glycerol-3-phosphate O-acyltransferase
MFRADAPFDQIFDDALGDMIAAGELAQAEPRASTSGLFGDSALRLGLGHDGLDGRGWVVFYAAVVRNFLEAYRIAARAVRVLVRGPLTEKELAQKALRVGEKLFLGGEIERSEAVSQPTLENAFGAFIDQGYLRRHEGKLALAESFASEATAETIEARVASYLAQRPSEDGW